MSKLRRPRFRPTLTSLFARYFLVVMVVELVIIIGFGFFVTRLYQGSDTERRRQFMEGTVALLRNNLQQQPHQSWSAVLAQEARAFRYPVKLIPGIPDDLSQEGQVALLKGQTYRITTSRYSTPVCPMISACCNWGRWTSRPATPTGSLTTLKSCCYGYCSAARCSAC
ncbi:hypothetical protein [Paludibacterium denitrificans]|uniref:hypothetical protein n=1 Tax=Paludibacterium denitrificans TaxID=2675226 RepID=UPI001E5F6EE8|nr:hypothetical protein [Paludibacterium denitrificans]